MTVSLVKFDGTLESLRKAIELCNGFNKLKANDRVLIKPNNCFRHPITPPYGMVTTSWMINAVVQLLLEYGCNDISIGEGSIIGIFDELNPHTKHGFKGTGIDKIASRYNVKLIDFNQGSFKEITLGGIKVEITESVQNTDFLINIPTLKTHFQTKVSLGFKNLKGCLSSESKKQFHKTNRLDNLIYLLNEEIKTDLVIIDGIYMLEKGPETLAGVAYRKNIIVTSTDIFDCDVIGSTILGINPSDVRYLTEYANQNNRTFDINKIEIQGERLNSLKENLVWQFEPDRELIMPSGITGLSAPSPGQTICCACAATLALSLSILAKDNPNKDFKGLSFYYGSELKSKLDTRDICLYGNCSVKRNSQLRNAITIKGCPPSLTTTLFTLMKDQLNKPGMLKMIFFSTIKLIGIRLGIYKELFPGWDRYKSKDFNISHFHLK